MSVSGFLCWVGELLSGTWPGVSCILGNLSRGKLSASHYEHINTSKNTFKKLDKLGRKISELFWIFYNTENEKTIKFVLFAELTLSFTHVQNPFKLRQKKKKFSIFQWLGVHLYLNNHNLRVGFAQTSIAHSSHIFESQMMRLAIGPILESVF